MECTHGQLARSCHICELESEVTEQCRLNAMGAEREARLMARVDELEMANERLRQQRDELAKTLLQITEAHVRLISALDEHEQNDPESLLEVAEAREALAKIEGGK